jgi:hypothetical protein
MIGGSTAEAFYRFSTSIGLMLSLHLFASAAAEAQIADNSVGRVKVQGNELLVESKVDDPRRSASARPRRRRGLGKISFDVLGPSHDEVVLIQGKQRLRRTGLV